MINYINEGFKVDEIFFFFRVYFKIWKKNILKKKNNEFFIKGNSYFIFFYSLEIKGVGWEENGLSLIYLIFEVIYI